MEYVGKHWGSCKAWNSKGRTSYWNGESGRPKITVNINDNGMKLQYTGKGSGYAIAHAKNGTGDSLHQAFNVIIYECNTYLIKGRLKPDINNVTTTCSYNKSTKSYDLVINIPFVTVKIGTYQLDRRGGWGHLGGLSDLPKKTNCKNYEGPVTVVTNTGGNPGKITEYFITYNIGELDTTKNIDVVINDWYRYANDKMYIYRQQNDIWYAKHVKSDKLINLSINPSYSATIESLNIAKKNNKLVKV